MHTLRRTPYSSRAPSCDNAYGRATQDRVQSGCAEDGLLGEDEMSQLSGRTLDLRNSAALLKLARMSVDATASKTVSLRCTQFLTCH